MHTSIFTNMYIYPEHKPEYVRKCVFLVSVSVSSDFLDILQEIKKSF